MKRHIPNILTVLRIPIAILCGYYAVQLKPNPLMISLALFVFASISDIVDGYLARKWKIETNFGRIIDPIADKILIMGVFIVFTYNGIIPVLFTSIIISREIILTVIRLLLLPKKVVISASRSGKVKTVSQSMVLIIIYAILIYISPLNEQFGETFINNTIWSLLLWAVFISVYSGIEFFVRNRKAISTIV